MAHDTQMWFFSNVKTFFPEFFRNVSVLEIGSLNVNGTCRDFFDECHYIGIDLDSGPSVDQVVPGQDFPGKAGSFNVVICTEVFEHTPDWDLILLNMLRLVRRDGMLIFTCAGIGRHQHGTRLFYPDAAPFIAESSEYYFNLQSTDFYSCIGFEHWFSTFHFIEDLDCLYFVGLMKGIDTKVDLMQTFRKKYDEYIFRKHRLGLPHEYIMNNKLY